MKLKNLAIALIGAVLAASCSTQKITYFNDSDLINGVAVPAVQTIKVRPGDKLLIVVNTPNAEVTNSLNIPYVTQRIGQTTGAGNSLYSQGMLGYTVDEKGDIQFPSLGLVHVAGLTRNEVAETIRVRLSEKEAKKAVVNVEFMNLTYSILGEVKVQGRYSIDRDAVTLLDAISMAGDLNITGIRDDIIVMRQENGIQKVYHVDITNAPELLNSPVYYVQQNDVIYVRPNKMRERQSTLNGNNLLSTSFWISLASLATSVLVLVKNW